MDIKQVIAVRKDLKLSKGKMSAQVAHASIGAYLKVEKNDTGAAKSWLNSGMKKVVVYVEDEKELFELKEKIGSSISTFVVVDAGHTQLEPGTTTCLSIGPAYEDKMDRYTGTLKLVN